MNAAAFNVLAVILLVLLTAAGLRAGTQNRTARTLVGRMTLSRARHSGISATWDRFAARLPRGRASERSRLRHSGPPPAQALATMLDDVARRCSSGNSLAASLLEANPVMTAGSGLHSAIASLGGGATIEEALGHERPTDPDTALAIHVLRLCALHGGNISESLDRAAATLRERHAERQDRIAQAAQARLSAKVLTIVPIVFSTWTMLTTASVQRFMTTPLGGACVIVGLGLNLIGWSLMNRAIKATP